MILHARRRCGEVIAKSAEKRYQVTGHLVWLHVCDDGVAADRNAKPIPKQAIESGKDFLAGRERESSIPIRPGELGHARRPPFSLIRIEPRIGM